MRLPKVIISTQPALIQLKTVNATQQIEQPPAQISIEQPRGELSIERTPPRLTIDQTEAFAAVDLKSAARRIAENADYGEQQWLAGIERVASEGDELMDYHQGNTIEAVAKRNDEPTTYDFNIGFVPPHGSVKMSYDPGRLDVRYEPRKPIIQNTPRKPTFTYEAGRVETTMKQYNDIKFEVTV